MPLYLLARAGSDRVGPPGGAFDWPEVADAHGLAVRAYLPVLACLFAWAATGALVISFVALRASWSSPRLERVASRRLFATGT
jgi:hypothetical protein